MEKDPPKHKDLNCDSSDKTSRGDVSQKSEVFIGMGKGGRRKRSKNFLLTEKGGLMKWGIGVVLCMSILFFLSLSNLVLRVEANFYFDTSNPYFYPLPPPQCGCDKGWQDICGKLNGTAGPPPANETTDPLVVCTDCNKDIDHCGRCGGCQLPFVTSNMTADSALGGPSTGNKLGSIASIATDVVMCGQYHSPQLAASLPTAPYGFEQEPPPSPPFLWAQQALPEASQDSMGQSSDATNDFLIIGDPESNPKVAHFYGRTVPFPPFGWFFDLEDPCGGNQFGYDVAVGEGSGFMAVCDPQAHFSGTLWVYSVDSPNLFQQIQSSEAILGDRFCHSVDMEGIYMAVGRPKCDNPLTGTGCVHFYYYNGTAWEEGTILHGGNTPKVDEGFGWRISMTDEWAFIGYKTASKVEVYQRDISTNDTWIYHSTLKAPGTTSNNLFGYAIQAREELVAIGDENFPVSATARGRVWTYRYQGNRWQRWAQYNDDTRSFNTRFGAALDMSDMYLYVGVPGQLPFGQCTLIDLNVTQCFGCDFVYGSCQVYDQCGVCGGNGSTCLGCDGIPYSGKVFDPCGVCGGNGTSCIVVNNTEISIPCSNEGGPLTSTNVTLTWLPGKNVTGYNANFTLISGPNVTSISLALNSTSGNVTITPPYFFEGAFQFTVKVCYIVPPAPLGSVCNTSVITVMVLPCVDCMGFPGSANRYDACGVCAGDNTTCEGCDGIPNSGLEFDYCGVCDGNNCTCLVAIVPPLVPGNCYPYYEFTMLHEPEDISVTWWISDQPSLTTATINPSTGLVRYKTPHNFISPSDTFQVSVKNTDPRCMGSRRNDTATITLPSSLFVIDPCGVCGGNGSTCLGCDGVPNSGLVVDGCGVCGGDGSTCPYSPPYDCGAPCILASVFFLTTVVSLIALTIYAACRYNRRIKRRREETPDTIIHIPSGGGSSRMMPSDPGASPLDSVMGVHSRIQGTRKRGTSPYRSSSPYYH